METTAQKIVEGSPEAGALFKQYGDAGRKAADAQKQIMALVDKLIGADGDDDKVLVIAERIAALGRVHAAAQQEQDAAGAALNANGLITY